MLAHRIHFITSSTRGTERMVKQAVARTIDLEPIDRLEEKVKLLVAMITQLRADQARASEDNTRMAQEIDSLRARLAENEVANSSELTSLRDERDIIRTRVTEMLEHLEHLSI
jgi:regulator of replication initiation timing